MCGRYVLFTDEEDDIAEIVHEIQRSLHNDEIPDGFGEKDAPVESKGIFRTNGEIFPTHNAAVLTERGPVAMTWGLKGFKGTGVIINARAESVYEKPLFRPAMLSRRLVVPSHGFFEWQKSGGPKVKLRFNLPGRRELYMAGLYNNYEDGPRFAILTAAANEAMKPIHNRMPVILLPSEVNAYLYDAQAANAFVSRVPPELVASG